MTANQYNYQRRKLLKQLANNLGPAEKFLFKGKTGLQAVRINRLKTLPATVNIKHHAARLLSRLSTLARGGGILLAVVGGYVGCQQIVSYEVREIDPEFCIAGSVKISGETSYENNRV